MMKKLLAIFAIVFSLLACSNDESIKSLNIEDSAFSIVGWWYIEKNNHADPLFDWFAEYTFTADGAVFVDEYRRINGYKRNERKGSYNLNDDILNFNFESKTSCKLSSWNSVTFKTTIDDESVTFQRIVGIITLNVGETISLDSLHNMDVNITMPTDVTSYTMTDDAVASIDEASLLTAKLIGVTYMKVKTKESYVILKISVSDEDSFWNDFSKALGKSFDDVVRMYGKHYAFRSDSIRYFYDSPYVDSVDIYQHNNLTDSIVATFREKTPEDIITNNLRKNLITVGSPISNYFTDNENYLLSSFSVKYNPEQRKLIYSAFEADWDDRRSDYGLTDKELEEKYGLSNRDSLGQKDYDIKVKNDFIIKISYALKGNPRRVDSYSALLNIDFPVEMIDDYINRKYAYYSYNDDYKHGKNIQIDGKEMILLVRRYGNSLRFMFIENK